jgi:hypothetical protein
MRLVSDNHLLQWDKLFEDIERVMKPGGAFEVRALVTRDNPMANRPSSDGRGGFVLPWQTG